MGPGLFLSFAEEVALLAGQHNLERKRKLKSKDEENLLKSKILYFLSSVKSIRTF